MATSGYSHFDDDMQENDYSQNNGLIKRKGRGYDKPKWGKSSKESMEFTKDGLCVIPKDAKLARFLGSLARNYNLLPPSPQNWRAYDDAHMEKLWKVISDTIDWRPEDIPHIPKIRYSLLKRLSKRVRNNRAELKNKYYTPHIGSPLRFTCGDDCVDDDQWKEMMRVERNIENRQKLKMSHTAGSMTFVRHYAGFEKEHGHEPDPIEAYELVHKRKDEQKSWIDDASEQTGKLEHKARHYRTPLRDLKCPNNRHLHNASHLTQVNNQLPNTNYPINNQTFNKIYHIHRLDLYTIRIRIVRLYMLKCLILQVVLHRPLLIWNFYTSWLMAPHPTSSWFIEVNICSL